MKYILAIDQSTQGSKVALYDENANIVYKESKSHRQIIDENGYISHNVEEIYSNILLLCKNVIHKSSIDKNDIVSIGLSNQRETTVLFDSNGKSLNNAVVWQCNRSKDIVKKYDDYKDKIKEKTGLVFSPFYSLSKARWLLDHVVENNDIHIGTIDSYIIYRLTHHFYTDYSNASRTQMLNIHSLCWDEEILKEFHIKKDYLAEIKDSDSVFGYTTLDGLLDKAIPINAVLGDSHAALFGHGCLKEGEGKITHGTGSSIMMNTGEKIIVNPLLSTSIGFKINQRIHYVIEGNINYAGAIITWLKDDVKLINDENEIESLIQESNPNDETILIPAFSGLGAPYYKNDMKAALMGMSRSTRKNEIVRAGVEAIALQISDVIDIMNKELAISSIKADGGPTHNEYLMQFESNLLNQEIKVSLDSDISLKGVAMLSGLTSKIYDDKIFSSNHYQVYKSLQNQRELIIKDKYHNLIHQF